MIVLNTLKDDQVSFGKDTNKITIFSKEGQILHFDAKSKSEVAKDIVNLIVKKLIL